MKLILLSMLYTQLQEIDFREGAPSIEVPVYMVIGKQKSVGAHPGI